MRISDWSSDLCSSDLWVDFPAGASRQEIDAAFGRAKALGRIGCVYLESPANPTNQLVDIAAVAEARDAFHPDPASRPPVIIDNTFLGRSEEHTSELQSLMRHSYAVFCLIKNNKNT